MPLSNPNHMLARIQQLAANTPDGSYIAIDDLKALIGEWNEEQNPPPVEDDQPPPKTVEEARSRAKQYLFENNPPQTPSIGRALSAGPQPSSRT